ncbi:MAG: hypothetical protein ACR2IV_03135 [Bryobacteraceae bacterium]
MKVRAQTGSVAPAKQQRGFESACKRSAAFSRLLFLVVVNRNGIKILCFENVTAIQAPDIIYPIAPVQELGSLVLTSLHSE